MSMLKKSIQMNRTRGMAAVQFSMDEDYNVPDSRPDVGSIVMKQGNAILEEASPETEQVRLKGNLCFEILYMTEKTGKMQNLSGMLPFEEVFHFAGMGTKDYVQCRIRLEDFRLRVIHSRKLHISAILVCEIRGFLCIRQEIAYDVKADCEIEKLTKELEVVSLYEKKRDTLKIREEIEVGSGKPGIDQILWQGAEMRNMEYRPLDGVILARGEAVIFLIYRTFEESMPLQWVEKTISFQAEIPFAGCMSQMVHSIEPQLMKKEMEVKTDEDGELRKVEIRLELELDIKLYAEEHMEVLSDAYAVQGDTEITYLTASYENLLIRNSAKCKLSEKAELSTADGILQICHSGGDVMIDRIEWKKDGILVEGAVHVTFIFLTSDDAVPIRFEDQMLPFSHLIEAEGVDDHCKADVNPILEQLAAVMVNGKEAEVRCTIVFETLVFQEKEERLADEITLQPSNIPQAGASIVGYIVQQDDSLWTIAKHYHSTMEQIRETNHMKEDTVKQGMRLLVVTDLEEVLIEH